MGSETTGSEPPLLKAALNHPRANLGRDPKGWMKNETTNGELNLVRSNPYLQDVSHSWPTSGVNRNQICLQNSIYSKISTSFRSGASRLGYQTHYLLKPPRKTANFPVVKMILFQPKSDKFTDLGRFPHMSGTSRKRRINEPNRPREPNR